MLACYVVILSTFKGINLLKRVSLLGEVVSEVQTVDLIICVRIECLLLNQVNIIFCVTEHNGS